MKLHLPWAFSSALGMGLYGLATAVINLSNVNTTGLSATCISVLKQSVACDSLLLQVGFGRYEDDATLSTVCTSSCAAALTTYIRRIHGACGTARYDGGDGYLYLAAFGAESTYERYQTTCLQNPAGQYCNAVIRDILAVDPSNQIPSSSIASQYTSLLCNDCFISSLATVLAMPISSAGAYSTALSEVTSSCKTTIAVNTPPTSTTWSLPATTSTPASCEGTEYDIQAGDTCQSISFQSGINSAAFLQVNGLPAYCANFPTSGRVCIPTSMKCTPYALQGGDTCSTIASKRGLTKTQLVSWNPEVGPLCGNIAKLASKGMTVCVSNPGGEWVDPNPPPYSTSTTTQWSLTITNSGKPFSAFPSATPIPTLLPNMNYITPFANGSWLTCDVYMSPPVALSLINSTYSYACSDVAAAYGITVDDLLLWNPGINTTGGFDDPCELSFAYKYCVTPKASLPIDTTKFCVYPAPAEPAWTCDIYAQWYNITKAAFVTWNPSVGTDCSNFHQGKTYCAAVEHFRPGGEISTCSYWAMANHTNPADNPCEAFETKYKLDHARFVAWNPSLNNDCSGIVRGYDYCVGTPTFHPGFPG